MRYGNSIKIIILTIAVVLILAISIPIVAGYIIAWYSSPIKPLKVVPVREDNKWMFTPIYSEIVYGEEQGIEVVIPSPSELGVAGTITSLKMMSYSPNKVIELYSGGYRPSIFLSMRGLLGELIREWATNRSGDIGYVKIPLLIDLFIIDRDKVYYYILVAHIDPREVMSLGSKQYIRIKPTIARLIHTYSIIDIENSGRIVSQNIIKKINEISTQGAGPFCDEFTRYEWRFNTTYFDIEKDFDGWIPVLAILNPYTYSATVELNYFVITINKYVYLSLTVVLGIETGYFQFSWEKFDIVRWILQYSERYIKLPPYLTYIEPNKAYILYVKGSGQINRYDLWYVKQEWDPYRGCVRTETWTGKIKLQTDAVSIVFNSDGSAVTRYEYVDNGYVDDDLSYFYANATTIGPYTLQPGQALDVHLKIKDYYGSQNCVIDGIEVGFPAGPIAAALLKNKLPEAKRKVLSLLPISVTVEYKGVVSFYWIARLSNVGSYPSGYNAPEYIYIYSSGAVYNYDNKCNIRLPFLLIRSV